MKKLIVLLTFCVSFVSRAEEGMWIPSLLKALNESDMKTMGMKISAEDIYSINHSSIKDAIVQFNGGCTAEVISNEGLLLTNHHCGFSAINGHSTQEHNYLEDGFWAKTKADELANPGMTCTFIIKIEDVTEELLSSIDGLTSTKDINNAFREKYQEIVDKEKGAGKGYAAEIKPFNYGNAYFVIVTETFKDIRLVGTPPDDIGKYGGNTDNWIWPRHTGDFSMFRIYADKDNSPAEYSESNQPFVPRHALPVSMEAREEGEFSMVYGFPGSTQQYVISDYVDFVINKELPRRIELRDNALDVINTAVREDQKKDKAQRKGVFLKYASKEASIANAWKKWIGQIGGLKSYSALDKKRALEKEYLKLAFEKEEYKPYREVLPLLREYYKGQTKFLYEWANFTEFYQRSGPEIFRASIKFIKLLTDSIPADELKKQYKDLYIRGSEGFYKNYEVDIDKEIFKRALRIYLNDPELNRSFMNASMTKLSGPGLDEYVDELYEKSMLTSLDKVKSTMNKFSKKTRKKLRKDPLLTLVKNMEEYYRNTLIPQYRANKPKEDQLMRLYVKGLMEMMPDKRYWYDANFTLRLTYGKVEGSEPRDGIKYKYYTTLDGLLAKYDPTNIDFELPEKLVDLARKRDYGPYAQDGEMFVCFTGSNHTSGGNSGSPCINGEGHLIGLNFDRSWESTMSDIMFDPNICRNIMVDIRYVLFIIDKFAGADHLIDEMELVTEEWREKKRVAHLKGCVEATTDKIKADAKSPDLLVKRALYYDSLGLEKSYKNDLTAALALKKDHPGAVIEMSNYLVKNNQNSKAADLLSKALRTQRNHPELLFNRGVIYIEMGQNLKATNDFSKVILKDVTHFKAYYNRGVAYYRLGKSDKACADFKMAQSLGDNKEYFIYESACGE
jgi:lipoprotein NlpI